MGHTDKALGEDEEEVVVAARDTDYNNSDNRDNIRTEVAVVVEVEHIVDVVELEQDMELEQGLEHGYKSRKEVAGEVM